MSADIETGGERDLRLPAIEQRQSFRGTFARSDERLLAAIERCASEHAGFIKIVPAEVIASVARWYDDAASEGLKDPSFAAELYEWMRFNERDEDWFRDGLTASCMALSGLEAWAASIALRPPVVRMLSHVGLVRPLVSESSRIRSAAALLLIQAPESMSDFDVGRAWYRIWLDLAAAGVVGVPMSALVDSMRHAQLLTKAVPLSAGHRLINCMRVGSAPSPIIARSARLPVDELLL